MVIKIKQWQGLTFEDNFFVFKNAIGIIIITLITYGYVKWNVNQGYRDKKRKLKHFIQTMHLAKGMNIKKMK